MPPSNLVEMQQCDQCRAYVRVDDIEPDTKMCNECWQWILDEYRPTE